MYVDTIDARANKSLLEALVSSSDIDRSNSEASKDDEEMLVDVPFIHHLSNLDDEREEARKKLSYVEMKMTIQEHGGEGGNRNKDEGNRTNTQVSPSTVGMGHPTAVIGKFTGYESEYMDSSDPRSYKDTSEGSSADDARRHKIRKYYYNPNTPLEDFYLYLKFKDLKLLKFIPEMDLNFSI